MAAAFSASFPEQRKQMHRSTAVPAVPGTLFIHFGLYGFQIVEHVPFGGDLGLAGETEEIGGMEGLSGIGYGDIGHKSGLFLFVVITASGK